MRPFGKASLVGIVMCLSLALEAGAAPAHDAPDAYKMIVLLDAPFGEAVLQGDHAQAIEETAGASKRHLNRFAAKNNLCVAYVRASRPASAETACDTAVAKSRRKPQREQAIALSNRGVLRALTGNTGGALEDFRAALRLRAGLSAPRENLERLTTVTGQVVAAR